MKKTLFEGVATALVTPMNSDGSIDYKSLDKLVDWQIEQGINALVACGTTGEASTLTDEEHRILGRQGNFSRAPHLALCNRPATTCCETWSRLLSFSQFSSVTQSCPTLCDPKNRSTPGLPVHHQLPEFTQTHAHRVSDAIQPSHPVGPFSSCPQSFLASGAFPLSQLFASGDQSIGASASASVLPVNIQG